MTLQRHNFERQALLRFEEIARRYAYPMSKGQGSHNRIPVGGNTYFQFGDLRVDTGKCYVLVEAESAGGVTNLVKYWYCLAEYSKIVDKPVILLHLFKQTSESDYGSHISLWHFLKDKMMQALGDEIVQAYCFTYRTAEDLDPALAFFEKSLAQ